jgi:hypothetical protein
VRGRQPWRAPGNRRRDHRAEGCGPSGKTSSSCRGRAGGSGGSRGARGRRQADELGHRLSRDRSPVRAEGDVPATLLGS